MESEEEYGIGTPFEGKVLRYSSHERHLKVIDIAMELTTEELLLELHTRGEVRAICINHVYDHFQLTGIREIMKFDAIMEKLDKIPENELDEFLNRY